MEKKTSDFQALPFQGRRIGSKHTHHQAASFRIILDAAGASVLHLPKSNLARAVIAGALRRTNYSPIVEASQQTEESLCHTI